MLKNGMRAIHPGEVLREDYLEPIGLTGNALAHAIHVTPARVHDILREKRGITADTALRLAKFFGGTPTFWLNMQSTYELRQLELGDTQYLEEIEPLELSDA